MPNRVSYTFSIVDDFTRKARQIAKQTRKVAAGMKAIGLSAQAASALVVTAFGMIKKALVSLSVTMAPLLAAFAGIAVVMKFFTVGTGFQDAIADLSSITKSTGKDLQFLQDESLRLGKKMSISAADVAEGFKLVASAKSELLDDPKALSSITEQILLLANASGEDLNTAANLVLRSMNQFGAEAHEASRFVNVLAASTEVGAAELADLGPALINSGTAAQLAGVNFEEMNAAMQVLAKGGLVGPRAGTGMQGAILKLNEILPGGIRGAGGLAAAFELLNENNVTATEMMQLFGLESIKAGNIIKEDTKLLSFWIKAVTNNNVAQSQADIRMASLTKKAKGLGVAIEETLIRTFLVLEPVFQAAVRDMRAFMESMTADDVRSFATDLGVVVRAMAEFVKLTAEAIRLISKLTSFEMDVGQSTLAAGGGGGMAVGGGLGLAGMMGFDREAFTMKNIMAKAIEQFMPVQGPALPPGFKTLVEVQVSGSPGSHIDNVKSKTTGGKLKTGINNPPEETLFDVI